MQRGGSHIAGAWGPDGLLRPSAIAGGPTEPKRQIGRPPLLFMRPSNYSGVASGGGYRAVQTSALTLALLSGRNDPRSGMVKRLAACGNGELEQGVRVRTQELPALATELSVAELRERRRMAVHLHDYLQQTLVLGKLTIPAPDHQTRSRYHRASGENDDALIATHAQNITKMPAAGHPHPLVPTEIGVTASWPHAFRMGQCKAR